MQSDVKPPPYSGVSEYVTYDLSRLTLPLDEDLDDEDMLDHISRSPAAMECRNVMIRYDNFWPKPVDLGLDDSQFAALKAALTQQFVIIQGPPGMNILTLKKLS